MVHQVSSQLSKMAFVGVEQMIDLVKTKETEDLLTELSEYIEQDFKRWELFDKSSRYASHSPDGVIELMPTSDLRQFSFKYVNGHPKNTRRGLQTVTAFGVLSDVDSGYPILLTEMTLLTALRTAATSALMAKYLAPKDSQCMAMIGCGAQSEFQVLAFKKLLGIKEIRLFDVDAAAAIKCHNNLQQFMQSNKTDKELNIVVCDSAEEAINDAHIITTCTADKKNATILTRDMVGPGVHINAIGGDCPGKTELAPELMRQADVFVEYTPQTRIEGDIQQLTEDFPVTEMHQVIIGAKPGRTNARQLTIFDGVGFAVEDFSALRYVYDLALSLNKVAYIDLITQPENPRNLFGMLLDDETKKEIKEKTEEATSSDPILKHVEGF